MSNSAEGTDSDSAPPRVFYENPPPPVIIVNSTMGSYKDVVNSASPSMDKSTAEVVKTAAPLSPLEFGDMNSTRSVVQPKISSVYNGMASVSFSKAEVDALSESFSLTLVGKFSVGIPKNYDVTDMLKDQSFKGRFTVSFMDKRNVVIKLFLEEDFNKLLFLENPNGAGTPFRFFKWTPKFSLGDESPIVPVWISLENLPIFLFQEEALFQIGKLVGVPVKLDGYTANRSKLHQATMCVEVDVSKSFPSHVWIQVMGRGVPIKVTYANVPHYCNFCKKLGHLETVCLAKEKPTSGNEQSMFVGNQRQGAREGGGNRASLQSGFKDRLSSRQRDKAPGNQWEVVRGRRNNNNFVAYNRRGGFQNLRG